MGREKKMKLKKNLVPFELRLNCRISRTICIAKINSKPKPFDPKGFFSVSRYSTPFNFKGLELPS